MHLDDQFIDLELLVIDVIQAKVPIRLLLLYRPPDTSMGIDRQLHDCINSLLVDYMGLIYFFGDFNLPGIKWDILPLESDNMLFTCRLLPVYMQTGPVRRKQA